MVSVTQGATIRKAPQVVGKTLLFRDARVVDAALILSLRTDEKKSRYLSATSADIDAQRAWLENYSANDDQAYFIIEYQGEAIGTVRLYDAQKNSFSWGSWILRESSPSRAAIESALMVYAYAIDHLGFQAAHFSVRKGNDRVWHFHERFGALRVSETEQDYLYTLDLQSIMASRSRYSKFLSSGVTISM